VDATHALDGRNQLDWEIEGTQDFAALQATTGGVIILTAHMGNYDIAAPIFAEKFGKKLHAVRMPEKHDATQEFMASTRDQQQSQGFQIHYNRPGNMLAVELAQAIHRHEAVAIQGDRVLGEVAAVTPVFDKNHAIRIPKGPFVLALATHAAVFPLFVIRMGWRRYRVLVQPVLPTPLDVRNREAAVATLTTAWVDTLRNVARAHWRQWFVLEDAFVPLAEVGPSAPASADDARRDLASDEKVRRLPATNILFSRWETALASLVTTASYGFGGVWALRSCGLSMLGSSLLLWPLMVLGVLLLTIVFFGVHGGLKQMGLCRNTPSQRLQAWLHYLLVLLILLGWFRS
jgi:predicted LPLAT superfamily acyltransferase